MDIRLSLLFSKIYLTLLESKLLRAETISCFCSQLIFLDSLLGSGSLDDCASMDPSPSSSWLKSCCSSLPSYNFYSSFFVNFFFIPSRISYLTFLTVLRAAFSLASISLYLARNEIQICSFKARHSYLFHKFLEFASACKTVVIGLSLDQLAKKSLVGLSLSIVSAIPCMRSLLKKIMISRFLSTS